MESSRKTADTQGVNLKRFFPKSVLIILFAVSFGLFAPAKPDAYMVKYKEDYYKLFHVHYQQYPDDVMENIYWLEQAVKADFANPLYADAKINDQKDWEKYRYLFMMHINLKLIEQHMRLGRTYDHSVAHFYDAPWKDVYIENLKKAKSCYEAGLYYWREASLWSEKASTPSFQFLCLTDIQNWEDENKRIADGSLDYEKILNREITRVQKVIDEFVAMDGKSY